MVWAASPPLSLHLAVPRRSVTLWEGASPLLLETLAKPQRIRGPAVSIPAGALDRITGKGA